MNATNAITLWKYGMCPYLFYEKVLILGIAYKKDVDDQRESPALRIIQLLKDYGAKVQYHDPHVPVCRGHRQYPNIAMKSVKLTKAALRNSDIVLLVTDHTALDYEFIEKYAKCIIDTRNAFRKYGIRSNKIFTS